MTRSGLPLRAAVCLSLLTVTACAGKQAVVTPAPRPVAVADAPRPSPPVPAPVPAPRDPIADLIAESTRLHDLGQRELADGHLAAAKAAFNRAIEVLLAYPPGARSESRLRAHFDQLVQRISAAELKSLAEGDGFTEKVTEPASIDQLLTTTTFDTAPPSQETTDAVTADLESTAHDIEIPLNDRVLSFVQLFTGRLKKYLEDGLGRGTRFLPMIQEVFRQEGVPQDLVYVPLVESAFKPTALSRAKAKGLWQFMPGTGDDHGLKRDWYVDERSDAEKATRAAATYLKTLSRMFDGDWHLALASYNAGPGRVQRAMKRSGRTDYWDLTESTRYLPRETRDYVPLVLAAIVVARNPAQYGLTVEPSNLPPYERVTVPGAVDLRRVAEWVEVPVQILQDLNPELRRWMTPVRSADYELKVPDGTAEIIRTRLAESEEARASLAYYTVKKGQTLASIAKALNVSRADLAEANYLAARARLRAGQQLIIPRAPALLLAGAAPEGIDVVSAADRPVDVPVPAVAAAPPPRDVTPPAKLTHRVKRGETLFSIARRYGITVASLKQWNQIRGSVIKVGQRLSILGTRALATH